MRIEIHDRENQIRPVFRLLAIAHKLVVLARMELAAPSRFAMPRFCSEFHSRAQSAAAELSGFSRSQWRISYFSEFEIFLAPMPHRHMLHQLERRAVDAVVRAQRRGQQKAESQNAARPPICRNSVRMSGVLGHWLGRKNSRTGVCVSSVR